MAENSVTSIKERDRFACLRQHAVPLVIISIHVCLLAYSGAVHSPTENEAAHLVAGLHEWHTGTFTLYRVNPPIVKAVAAIPVVVAGYNEDWSGYTEAVGARPVFNMGEHFIRANGRNSFRLMTMARWACIPFSVLGAWICFLWGRDLFGKYAGYMACCLWCFSPMVLGNAALITPDAHATSLGLAACYTFWRWLKQPTWTQAIVTGGVLGLAELSKTTLILFYPLWPLIWLIYRLPQRKEMAASVWRREAGMLVLRMVIGIYVINLGYFCDGSFTRLGDFRFVSQTFRGDAEIGGNRFKDTWLGEVYVPFPADYLIGIDIQQRDFEKFSRPSYLRGQYQETGWWYYYLYAILVKAPAGTLGLIALTLAIQISRYRAQIFKRDVMVLLTPAVVIFVVVSMKTGFSHHSRYILPCVPFVFIFVSQLALLIRDLFVALSGRTSSIAQVQSSLASQGDDCGQTGELSSSVARPDLRILSVALGGTTAILLCWSIASSLAHFPHSLSYFNEFAGGAANGPRHLINSNVDWGQDLLFLEDWIVQQPDGKSVFLAFFNYYNPFDLGIKKIEPWPFEATKTTDKPNIPDGYYAISINLLYEYPWPIRDRDARRYRIDNRPLSYLRSVRPVGRAGDSIRIFSADQMREAWETPENKLLSDKW